MKAAAAADPISASSHGLEQAFNDPFDPRVSIQLNNRHWPGERYALIGLLREAESAVRGGNLAAAANQLERLRPHFQSAYTKFLQRLHRLHTFRSSFGYDIGRVELSGEVIAANRYAGPDSRASYPLANVGGFADLVSRTRSLYRAEYGSDLVKMNCSVRFARPDASQADITDFGDLSDYHNDEYKGISTIVYLSDVSEDNGAFSYIRGSHLIPRSLVLTAIHQCVEFDLGFKTPEQLASLPLEFRGSVGIGNFLDHDKLEAVKRCRQALEGPAGTYVTFNGQYVLHRGGKPLSGTRVAAFFQPEGVLRHKLSGARSRLFAMAQA
jgi:hypothetical protein